MRISDWNFRRVLFRSDWCQQCRSCRSGRSLRHRPADTCHIARQISKYGTSHCSERVRCRKAAPEAPSSRSEEHTSELQSLMRISYAVFCLKKKKKKKHKTRQETKTKIT